MLGGVAIGFGPAGLVPFLVAGAILGAGSAASQVADRVLMVRLSPPERIGEFFGLYGLVGKGSQVIGTLLYGVIIFLLLDRSASARTRWPCSACSSRCSSALWLVWPVRDDWAGSGDVGPASRSARAERSCPSEPRSIRPTPVEPRWRSVRVAARVALPPGPRRADHLLERRGARGRQPSTAPARAAEATSTGGSPVRRGPDLVWDRAADDRLRRGDDLADR